MASVIDNKQWIRVVGAKEIQMNLANLADPKTFGNKVLKPAIIKGLAEIRKIARKKLRKNKSSRTGSLSRSLKTEVKKDTMNGRVFVNPEYEEIGRKKRIIPRYYAHLVEYGTAFKPKGSVSKRGRKLKRSHAATAAKPFLRPAMDEGRPAAFAKIAAEAKKKFAEIKSGVKK